EAGGRAAAGGAAEHALEDVLEAAEPGAAAAGAAEAAGKDRLEILRPKTAAGLAAESLEAVEARLAVGTDLAAVERLALAVVAQDLVGAVELAEALRRLRIAFVGVRVQLLGELAIGALDGRRIGRPRHPQYVIGVAH